MQILQCVMIIYFSSDINECHSDPCMNGATCEDGVFQYTCSCVDGYTGTHCETGNNESRNLIFSRFQIWGICLETWPDKFRAVNTLIIVCTWNNALWHMHGEKNITVCLLVLFTNV